MDGLAETDVSQWFLDNFEIDLSASLNWFTPKVCILDMAKEHALLGPFTRGGQVGERWVGNTILATVAAALPNISIDVIDSHSTYHDPSKSGQQKVRSLRNVRPRELSLIDERHRTRFGRIFSSNTLPIGGAGKITTRKRRACDITSVQPSTSVTPQPVTTMAVRGVRPAVPSVPETDTIEGIEIKSCDDHWAFGEATTTQAATCIDLGLGTQPLVESSRDAACHAEHEADECSSPVCREGECSTSKFSTAQECGSSSISADIIQTILLDPYGGDWLIYVVELYAGTATCIRQMLAKFGDRLRALIVDIDTIEKIGVADIVDRKRVFFKKFDLANVEPRDFEHWCLKFLKIEASKVHRVHASFNCMTFAFINLCNKNAPRDKYGNAVGEIGGQHDQMLIKLLVLYNYLITRNPLMLQSIENPQHSSFLRSSIIRGLIQDESWHTLFGDHCAGASELLDGKVHGPAHYRIGGLTAEKSTVYLVRNISSHLQLLKCKVDGCRMKVPGRDYHVWIVANHTGEARFGQRRMPKSVKAVIPLGVHKRIFDDHREHICTNGRHSDKCANCGKGHALLLRCQNPDCRRSQHPDCSDDIPDNSGIWRCDTCNGTSDK